MNLTDETKKELRAFALQTIAACIPLFVSWAIDEAKRHLRKDEPHDRDRDRDR